MSPPGRHHLLVPDLEAGVHVVVALGHRAGTVADAGSRDIHHVEIQVRLQEGGLQLAGDAVHQGEELLLVVGVEVLGVGVEGGVALEQVGDGIQAGLELAAALADLAQHVGAGTRKFPQEAGLVDRVRPHRQDADDDVDAQQHQHHAGADAVPPVFQRVFLLHGCPLPFLSARPAAGGAPFYCSKPRPCAQACNPQKPAGRICRWAFASRCAGSLNICRCAAAGCPRSRSPGPAACAAASA